MLVRDETLYIVKQWIKFQLVAAESDAAKTAKDDTEILRIAATYRDQINRMKTSVLYLIIFKKFRTNLLHSIVHFHSVER